MAKFFVCRIHDIFIRNIIQFANILRADWELRI